MRPKNVKQASEWGKRGSALQKEDRLYAALHFEPVRPVEDILIFEVRTFNPLSGQRHLLELKHALRNGRGRYDVYIDGVRRRNQWSRWGFVNWMFDKIDAVRVDWD